MNRWLFKNASVVACLVGTTLFAPLVVVAEDATPGPIPTFIAGNAPWCLRLPQEKHVVYRGVVSFDEAGTGTSSFLYPAPNAVGLLAAVMTHGFIVESAKNDQKEKLQESADKVLLPYKFVLDNFNCGDLMRRAVKKTSTGDNAKIIEDSGDPGREMVVESAPVFSLTQDQKAIILDNTIVIHMPGVTPATTYRNTARVVSSARNVADPAAFWTANNGEKLKDESAQLVAESLNIAFRDVFYGTGQDGVSYRTIRYQEGTTEKIERAQVLSESCDRLLIRTLRGALMSVPTSQSGAGTSTVDTCGRGTTSAN